MKVKVRYRGGRKGHVIKWEKTQSELYLFRVGFHNTALCREKVPVNVPG